MGDNLELYSLRDLIAISDKGGEKFIKGLEATLARYDKHITKECLHCQARGHVCEFCNSKEILFPFQVENTRQCSGCQSYFHSECYRKMRSAKKTCPKCARIAALRDQKDREGECRVEVRSTDDTSRQAQ